MKSLLIILFLKTFTFLHPVHVSILNFEYTSKGKTAEMSVKAFTDDFELAFIHNYNIQLNLGKDSIHPEWENYVNQYFSKMFSLKINNKTAIPLVFKKYEIEDDGIKLFFTAPIKGKVKSIQIDNGLLLDVLKSDKPCYT
ncbi:MAG: hypothetical protein HC830_01930 [Bacteroidetes bacterium]|nr:hypothetical protein [Bacteroidota bacterium]